ncbi:hypothetical protein [Thermogladius calderae]|uniref:hypothetical protein n=1 Tax=Thermogladius calderae TaxID=1200300 RepID=UPI00138A4D69|nr:hypothetical protein [Thermogladius calderae]
MPGMSLSQQVSSIGIRIVYDPIAGAGVVTYNIVFSSVVATPVNFTIGLLPGSNITVLNVTSSNGAPLPYFHDQQANVVTVLLNNTSGFTLTYSIRDLMTTLVPGSYSVTLDTSAMPGSVSVDIYVPGLYNVSCVGLPCSTRLDFSSNTTNIHVDGRGILILTLTVYTQGAVSPTTPPTTTSPAMTATTTSPQTTTSAPTTPAQPPAATTTPSITQGPRLAYPALVVVILVVLVVLGVIGVVLARKRA